MDLKPVRRVRLSAQIEEQLKQQLLEGRWKAGERLPSEHELSRIFQVSRVSIRQALQALSAQGLIETRSGDGSFVKQPDIRDLMQGSIPDIYLTEDSLRWVMEFRRLFEGPVAELAAQRATEEQLQQMDILYQRMIHTAATDIQEHCNCDFEFHMLIGCMAHNPMIEGVYRVQNSVMRAAGATSAVQRDRNWAFTITVFFWRHFAAGTLPPAGRLWMSTCCPPGICFSPELPI